MQLVVVMAVRKAVSAATITFTAISTNRFFIIVICLSLGFAAWLSQELLELLVSLSP